MKKLILITAAIFIANLLSAQVEFWGMTSSGGTDGGGVIFKTDSTGNNQSIAYNFSVINIGRQPQGKLYQASNGKFYGMTKYGGTNNKGVLFEYDPAINTYTKKIDFNAPNNGANPAGSLIQVTNGKLYGMTKYGGTNNIGVIFEYDIATNTLTKKADFTDSLTGKTPSASLIQASNGKLYGMTKYGGIYNKGVLFEYDIANDTLIKKVDFDLTNKGANPNGSLMQASNGKLYGMTSVGGANSHGVLFEYDIMNDTLIKKVDLGGNKGSGPWGSLMQAANGKLYGMTRNGGANNQGVLFEYDIASDTLINKLDFDGTNKGSYPNGSLMQASNGKLYGMTSYGGTNNRGVFFEYDLANDTTVSIKINFDGDNKGANPYGLLMQATNGKLYGMTNGGGIGANGVLFEYNTANNTFIKKIDFSYNTQDGYGASTSLMLASNGKFYGFAHGGINGDGVLFEFNSVTSTYSKKADFKDTLTGRDAYGELLQANNGKLYGMTYEGGVNGVGAFFEYDIMNDTLIKKLDFDGANNGAYPDCHLLQATNGKLYGVTGGGGVNSDGVLFEYDINTNTFIKKVDFNYTTSGANPFARIIQASNGKLYGTTYGGGAHGGGVVYEYDITMDTLIIKANFDGTNKGARPYGSLVQASNGKLYGMTIYGGTNNKGVIYEYDIINDTLIKKIDFDGTNGRSSYGSLIQAPNGKLYGMTLSGGTNNIGVLFEYNPQNNTYIKSFDFNGMGGANPNGSLIMVSQQQSVSFTTSSNNLTSPPFNVSFTNTSVGYNSYYWNLGDGDMSNLENPTHTYLYNGTYTVTLFATDTISNQTDTATQIITCSGGTANPCTFTAELTQPQSSAMICFGDSVRLSATALPNITYAWVRNGSIITGATDSIFYAKQEGFYMAVLSSSSCSKLTSNYFVLANYPHITPAINVIGSIAPCSNDSLKLEATAGFTNYTWNNGKTGQSIYVNNSGYYSVEVIDNNGCVNQSQETIINTSLADIPHICAVSVDVNTNHNIINWQAQSTLKIDSFRVYCEGSVTNQYDYIGSVAYNDPLELEDVNSNVAVRQYAYKITAIDTCGKETPVSLKHKTMHLMINQAINNHWNLIWMPYEGFAFGSYNIYRGTDSSNMTLLTTIASSNTTYTDITNPSGDVYYQIEVVSSDPCGAKSFGTSRSNCFNTKNASGLGLNTASGEGISMMLYPNPNKGRFTLNIKSTNGKREVYTLEVFSPIGALIHSEQLEIANSLSKQMHFEDLSKGVYFIRLSSKSSNLNARFIVQ